jgi:SAM-dependent methyltransferase
MHPFKLGHDAYVGTFKHHRLPGSVFLRSEPELYDAAARAYADVTSGEPFARLDEALVWLGVDVAETTFLDIACATGLYSFHLAARGAKRVRGVEIREQQVEQARLLQRLDERFARAPLTFDLQTSGDDPAFLAGERYDVVLSFGLLYHLADPWQHLRNLRRLARRGVVLQHADESLREAGALVARRGGPGGDHESDERPLVGAVLPRSALAAASRGLCPGTARPHPLMGRLQPPVEPGPGRRAAAMLAPPALAAIWSRVAARAQARSRQQALLRGLIPGYYTIVAWS